MDSVKVIDISSLSNKSKSKKKLTKKQLYKEILSSSDKVKEIISNRKKTQRFDYLNSQSYPTIKPKIKLNLESKNDITKNVDNKNSIKENKKSDSNKELSEKSKKKSKPKSPRKKRSKNKESSQSKSNENAKITNYFKKEPSTTKQVSFNENVNQELVLTNTGKNIDEKSKEEPKSEQTIISALQKTKPILKNTDNNKITPKKKSPKNQVQRSKIKKFNDKQILNLLTILIKLNKLGKIVNNHRTIRHINKYRLFGIVAHMIFHNSLYFSRENHSAIVILWWLRW